MASSHDSHVWLQVVWGSITDTLGGNSDGLYDSFSHSYLRVGSSVCRFHSYYGVRNQKVKLDDRKTGRAC